MKKIVSLFLAVASAAGFYANAELGADGYYRISNYYTNRYVYIVDNTGSINVSTTTIETGAIELWRDIDRTLYDPATVLYMEKHDKQYDIRSQGTGIYQMLGTYVSIYEDPRNPGTYWAYGSKSGMVAYLWDSTPSTYYDESTMTNLKNDQYPLCRNWYITPIDNNTDNYFGVKPTVSANGAYYAEWFAEFPFSFAGTGMEACYVTKIDAQRGYAVYKTITGTVPGRTPIFIKCSSEDPVNNKLNIGGNASNVNDNILTGVFFNCKKYKHDNRVAYDKNTMRSLGLTRDGKLGMIKGSYDYVPRNTFYLQVPANTPDDLVLITEEEYNQIISTPIEATSVTLNQTAVELNIGQTAQLTATVLPDNTTDKTVTWTTSNAAIATVDANGKITANAIGTATITATCGQVSATCQVTVKPVLPESITLNTTSLDMHMGETYQLNCQILPVNTTDKTTTWTSSNTAVATVNAAGIVTATGLGTATITVTCGSVSATCQVTVNPILPESISLNASSITLLVGESHTLTCQILPVNTTDKTTAWTSSNTAVATVNAAGVVTAVGVGEATITVSCGAVSASCQVTVNPVLAQTVTISQSALGLEVDDVYALTVQVLPANTTDPAVVWSSSNADVATVDANGKVTAMGKGTATITAACGSVSGTCEVTVRKKQQSIIWNQIIDEATVGDVIELNATATSGLEVVYTVDQNASVAANLLTVLSEGTVTVTATQDGDRRHEAAEPLCLTFNAVAGINDIKYDALSITVDGSTLVVSGKPDDACVMVFNMQGALVYAGCDNRISLPAKSAYIVKVGLKAVKVATR